MTCKKILSTRHRQVGGRPPLPSQARLQALPPLASEAAARPRAGGLHPEDGKTPPMIILQTGEQPGDRTQRGRQPAAECLEGGHGQRLRMWRSFPTGSHWPTAEPQVRGPGKGQGAICLTMSPAVPAAQLGLTEQEQFPPVPAGHGWRVLAWSNGHGHAARAQPANHRELRAFNKLTQVSEWQRWDSAP